MKILLVCAGGMSTSLLVTRMSKSAEERGIKAKIEAVAASQGLNMMDDWDIIMLGPQVRHQRSSFESKENHPPIAIIDMRDYGMMNGANVLDAAMDIICKK